MSDTAESRARAIHERKRAEIVSVVPGWYRPGPHLAIPSVLGLGVMVAAIGRIHDLRWYELLAIPITLFASFALEWRAHRYVLHKKTPLLGILYRRHEHMHHVIYTYDDMQLRSPRELWLILMPAYAIVLVFFMVVPFAVLTALLASTNAALLMVSTSMLFFLSYEWLHMAYHLPTNSFVGRLRFIQVLRELHRRHHDPSLMKRWNFNVTVPVFDWIKGTLWSPERAAAAAARPVRSNPGEVGEGLTR